MNNLLLGVGQSVVLIQRVDVDNQKICEASELCRHSLPRYEALFRLQVLFNYQLLH